MLRSRLLGLSYRGAFRISSRTDFQTRGYAKGKTYRELKLIEQPLYTNESANFQLWRNYGIPVAMLVIAGAGFYIHQNDEKRAIPKGSHESTMSDRSTVNRPAIGGPFRLFNTENCLVTDSDLRGNWTLMYFGYTSSPDVGPEEVQKFSKVIDIIESQHNLKITPVFITIDPQRDSPEQLKAYLKEFDSRIFGLTGPIASVRQIAHEYRVYFKKIDEGQDYLVESSHNMYLLDPNLETVRCFGLEYDAEQLSDSIVMEMKKASK